MISIDAIAVEFSGESLFSDVSFVVNENDKIALMGKNGGRKVYHDENYCWGSKSYER